MQERRARRVAMDRKRCRSVRQAREIRLAKGCCIFHDRVLSREWYYLMVTEIDCQGSGPKPKFYQVLLQVHVDGIPTAGE